MDPPKFQVYPFYSYQPSKIFVLTIPTSRLFMKQSVEIWVRPHSIYFWFGIDSSRLIEKSLLFIGRQFIYLKKKKDPKDISVNSLTIPCTKQVLYEELPQPVDYKSSRRSSYPLWSPHFIVHQLQTYDWLWRLPENIFQKMPK